MTLRLDRLQANTAYFDAQGRPTQQMQIFWNKFAAAIETNVNAVAAAQAAADAANAAAAAADTAAANAQTAADTAQAVADATTAETALNNSYVTGLTTFNAADAGASVTITISAHTRVYTDGASVAVSGGTITGLAYSTVYRVYYDDALRAGGAVTYQATTVAANAAQTGARHSMGAITTPAPAGGPIDGNEVLPPGWQVA